MYELHYGSTKELEQGVVYSCMYFCDCWRWYNYNAAIAILTCR